MYFTLFFPMAPDCYTNWGKLAFNITTSSQMLVDHCFKASPIPSIANIVILSKHLARGTFSLYFDIESLKIYNPFCKDALIWLINISLVVR